MQKGTKQATRQERVLTTTDLLFKKIFASPQNSHILTGFINDILELGATDVSIENPYNIDTFHRINENPKIKYTQVDVLARLEDGSQVTIEMQVVQQRLFRKRAFFYVADIYTANYDKQSLIDTKDQYIKAEKKYSSLRPVYSICIMAENEFLEDDNPIHEFRMYDVKNKMFYINEPEHDVVRITFLEIKKSSKEIKENIKAWFDYFNTGNVKKDAPKYIQEACALASYKNLSGEEVRMISEIQKSIDATQDREDYVWYSGKSEGRAEGKAERNAEIISFMISKGKNVEEIVELIGVTKEEVEKFFTPQ